jgi:uncharacterized membrane protein
MYRGGVAVLVWQANGVAVVLAIDGRVGGSPTRRDDHLAGADSAAVGEAHDDHARAGATPADAERTRTMSETTQLLAAVYPDREHAKVTFDMLRDMHRAVTITLVDGALITKDDEGKIKVVETTELTTRKGARRGAIITGVLGLIYPPSLLGSMFVGGAIGAVAGRLRDTGIKNPQLREIADRLEPGKAAVIVLAEEASTAKVQEALAGFEGELVVQVVDDETLKELYKGAGADV